MKKIIFVCIILVMSFWLLPQATEALDLGDDLIRDAGEEAGYDPGTDETTLAQTIGTGIKALLALVGVIFTMLMVYAGSMWMTARGEEDKITKAKDIIKASIIGLIITLAAYSITAFVVPRLLERTTTSLPLEDYFV